MNLSQIETTALELIGASTDSQVKDDYKNAFKTYANEAQRELALYLRQFRTDSLTVVNGKVDLSQLPMECVKVLSVKASSSSYTFSVGGSRNELEISGLNSGQVSVKYEYVPEGMENDQDIPDLPASMHNLIAVYVAARENTGKDPQRASALMEAFERGKRLARSSVGGSDSFAITGKW